MKIFLVITFFVTLLIAFFTETVGDGNDVLWALLIVILFFIDRR